MQKSFTTLLSESKEDLKGLFRSKKELWKLTALEKSIPIGIQTVYTVILATLGLFLLSFLLMAGAFGLSLLFTEASYETLRGICFGFLCLCGALLLLLLLLLALRSSITTKIEGKIMTKYLDKMEDEEQKKEQKEIPVYTAEELEDIPQEAESGQTIKPIVYHED